MHKTAAGERRKAVQRTAQHLPAAYQEAQILWDANPAIRTGWLVIPLVDFLMPAPDPIS